MADTYTAEYSTEGGERKVCPDGLQHVVCVDGIYLGHKVDQYQNNPAKLVEKYALVFQTADFDPETKRRYEVSREFTISMGPKSNLRKFLSSWRGKAYTDAEAAKVPLHKTVGFNGLATIEHKTSAKGNVYAVITNIVPLPNKPGFEKIAAEEYERAPYWEERKAEYKAGADAFLAAQQNGRKPGADDDARVAAALAPEADDLPF